MAKKLYKVTYSGTRASHSYSSKRSALAQARWATQIGNMRACVHKRVGAGYIQVACVKRRKRRAR